jgi:CTP:molybdopterin cytidylyltransferase MocA
MSRLTRQDQSLKIAAVLLVAGMSQRLGFPKQTYVYQGKSLIKRQFSIIQASQIEKIYLVTGAYRKECHLEMQGLTGWKDIYNSAFSSGMEIR